MLLFVPFSFSERIFQNVSWNLERIKNLEIIEKDERTRMIEDSLEAKEREEGEGLGPLLQSIKE